MAETPEPPDGKIYYSFTVYVDTFIFLKKAMAFYRDLLKKELEALSLDEELRELISARPEQAKVFESEVKKLDRILEFYKKREDKEGPDPFDYDLGSMSHGMIRYTKAVALLYLAHLRHRRNEIAKRRNLSKHILTSIDEELARKEETFNTHGIFCTATPVQLLAEQAAPITENAPPDSEPTLTSVARPRPVVLSTIPILNPILKARCLDLFSIFHETSQHDRFDTVLSDATRVLEDRMRAILDVEGRTGDELAVLCFTGNPPRLLVSNIAAEQQGVLLLFKGIFSHIRNPVHHKLNAEFTPERTLQIMGLVDYAIHVLETAVKRDDQKS